MRQLPSLLSLVAGLVLSGCSRTAEKNPSERLIVAVQRAEALGGAESSDSAPEYIGAVRANEETDLSFKVGGILELIGQDVHRDWEEGSAVKAGTLLARLQQADFKNALASAKAAAELAASNNERLRKLVVSNVVSKQEADKGRADTETAEAHLRQAEQNLRDSELHAPWDGVILGRRANSGETVATGKPVLRFGDIQTMSVEFGMPDRLVGLFSVGKEMAVVIAALPGRPPFPGKVSEVGVAATNAGRLYRVVVKVPNADGAIKSGMTATLKASGLTTAAAGQVLVPLSALVAPPVEGEKVQDQLAVFVVQDGKASLRRVATGDIVASSIIVTKGLKAGDEVATRGASLLYDGAPVEAR